jgi:hypothetical protein
MNVEYVRYYKEKNSTILSFSIYPQQHYPISITCRLENQSCTVSLQCFVFTHVFTKDAMSKSIFSMFNIIHDAIFDFEREAYYSIWDKKVQESLFFCLQNEADFREKLFNKLSNQISFGMLKAS